MAVSTRALSEGPASKFMHQGSGIELHGSVPLMYVGVEGERTATDVSLSRLRTGTPKRLGSLRSSRAVPRDDIVSSDDPVAMQRTVFTVVDSGDIVPRHSMYDHHAPHNYDGEVAVLWALLLAAIIVVPVCCLATERDAREENRDHYSRASR